MKLSQFTYLGWWYFRAKFLGRRKPMQTVQFISDRCNLQCKHCSVYQKENPHDMTFDEIEAHLRYSYSLGSRFVDFEGGEVMLWHDGDKRINDLIDLAKKIGFFSTTITTNAQLPFSGIHADSIWVSLDGLGKYHDEIRGEGTFERLEKNISTANHPHLSVNMVINSLNYKSVDETLEYVKNSPYIESISFNFHTAFPGTEYLTLDNQIRKETIDKIIRYKKNGYPIMNTKTGLKRMIDCNFKKRCWITNFVYPNGLRGNCVYENSDACNNCGFCMAGEMSAVFNLAPETIMAGFKLRTS